MGASRTVELLAWLGTEVSALGVPHDMMQQYSKPGGTLRGPAQLVTSSPARTSGAPQLPRGHGALPGQDPALGPGSRIRAKPFSAMDAAEPELSTLAIDVREAEGVAVLELARPARRNALAPTFFQELPRAVRALDEDPRVRVVVLQGQGRHFCAGIDLAALEAMLPQHGGGGAHEECEGREREKLRRAILGMQAAISALEHCRKPVIAAVHGACVGAGVDIITACDFRYCSASAQFSVKEVDLGITADLGTLQRLAHIVGEGHARELALTARTVGAQDALQLGLVQRVLGTDNALRAEALEVAKAVAQKSPLAVVGTKAVLNFSRDHSVKDGLEFVATWNSAMLMSRDLREALQAAAGKRPPVFAKL